MIGFLSGTSLIFEHELVVMTNGVGYSVTVGPKVLASCRHGAEIQLHIHTLVKEDALQLFGFHDYKTKQLFGLLLTVSGVGPKIALVLVDQEPQQLIDAVQNAEISFFTAIPRVGKKLAQKIIIELRSKLGEMKALNLGFESDEYQSLLESLLGLGFSQRAVETALQQIDLKETNIDIALKQAIQLIGKSHE